MRNLETKMNNQITKTAENRYFPYIYICSFKKHANFMSFYKNIFRREIPKWNGSSCGAFFSKETLSLLESLRISSKEGSLHSFFRFFSHTDHYRLLRRVPSAIQ